MKTATLLVRAGAIAMLLGSVGFSAPRAYAQFTDDFSGTTLKPEWTETIPVDGPTFTVEDGLLKIYLPGGAFDEWTGVSNAPHIEMAAPAGDFTMTGRLNSVVGADGTTPAAGDFHGGLMVDFGGSDKIMYGAYRSGSAIRLERSGTGFNPTVTDLPFPVDLRIIRAGNAYHFYYKQIDAPNWTELANNGTPVIITDAKPVETVGIFQKTWGGGPELTASWDQFTLSPGQDVFLNINGTVATTGGGPSKLHAQLLNESGAVLMTAPINNDGTFTLPAAAGTYTVRLVGSDLLSPASEASKPVTVQAGQNATVSFTGIQVAPDIDPATSEKVTTDFPGPELDPRYFAREIPKAGPEITADNGLHINVPSTTTFDLWTAIDESPKVRIPTPPGDFIVSALLGGTGPDGGALAGNFNIYMAIKFAPNDAIVFTRYRDEFTLEVLRIGGAEGQQIQTTGGPVHVQVRKIGNRYFFYYREEGEAEWKPFGPEGATEPKVITDIRKPVDIQLGVKTWAPIEINAEFSDFNLEAMNIPEFVTVNGTVTTNAGTSPAATVIRIRNADGNVVASLPVAENGAFTTTLVEGSYTFSVVGNVVQPNQPGATQTVNVAPGMGPVNFNVNLYPPLTPGSGVMFTDPFTGSFKPEWTVDLPAAGPNITVTDNQLNITIPDTRGFDIWAGVPDTLPKLALPNPGGDFIMTATLNSVTDPEGNPLENVNFQSGLIVDFGGDDAIMWGAYRSNSAIKLERSGTGYETVLDLVLPAQLQIRRVGDTYTFWYRQTEDDPWQQLMTGEDTPREITVTKIPELVGIFQKAWTPMNLTALWDDFSLESVGGITPPPTGCKGDASGDGQVNVGDAVLILRHAVNLGDPLTGQNLTNAQVTAGDSDVNVADAVAVLQAIVGVSPGKELVPNLTCP